MEVAQSVCEHLGTRGVLSLSPRYDAPLRERIERARAADTAAFVSIQSHAPHTAQGAPEVWIFGDGGNASGRSSEQLGRRITAELATLDGRPVALRTGDVALLRPEIHGKGAAACVVETGPSGPAGGRDPRTDRIGRAVARGVSTYLESDFKRGGATGR